jgi:hypothetical protein
MSNWSDEETDEPLIADDRLQGREVDQRRDCKVLATIH